MGKKPKKAVKGLRTNYAVLVKLWGYPFNQSNRIIGPWRILALANITHVRLASSRPGSGPTRTVSTTWSGCGGPRASSVPLLTLYRRGRVLRQKIGGEYLYVSVSRGSAQVEQRQEQRQAEAAQVMGVGLVEEHMRGHLRAFVATLNEKQRRLYAGFDQCASVAAATPSSRAGPGSMSRPWPGDGRNCRPVARPWIASGRWEPGDRRLRKTHEPN